jgi:antitoxin component YwqK of YwqJK toxin-antitoxin module
MNYVKYKDGKRDGVSVMWDENGVKQNEQTYQNGKLLE